MRFVLLFALVLSGCAVRTCSVSVDSPEASGRGVIVGPKQVCTVAHVVLKHCGPVWDPWPIVNVEGHAAKTVAWNYSVFNAYGPDGIVLLELVDNYTFDENRIATLAPKDGGPGVTYLSPRGPEPWAWGIRPGDSGSPVLDAEGRVIGLVRAFAGYDIRLREGMVPEAGK
jgi:hypothetical protein